MESELIRRKLKGDDSEAELPESENIEPGSVHTFHETTTNDPVDHDLDDNLMMEDEDEEDEETKKKRIFENNIKLPLIVFGLTFFFPPLGFMFFLKNKNINPESRRYAWVKRALGLGSALSALYMLIICCVLHHTILYKGPNDLVGYGYEH